MSVMLGCRKPKLHAFVAAARALILALGTNTVRFSLALRISRAVSLTATLSFAGVQFHVKAISGVQFNVKAISF